MSTGSKKIESLSMASDGDARIKRARWPWLPIYWVKNLSEPQLTSTIILPLRNWKGIYWNLWNEKQQKIYQVDLPKWLAEKFCSHHWIWRHKMRYFLGHKSRTPTIRRDTPIGRSIPPNIPLYLQQHIQVCIWSFSHYYHEYKKNCYELNYIMRCLVLMLISNDVKRAKWIFLLECRDSKKKPIKFSYKFIYLGILNVDPLITNHDFKKQFFMDLIISWKVFWSPYQMH